MNEAVWLAGPLNLDIQVWFKPLSDGSIAVGVFNLGEKSVDYQLF